MTGRLATVDTPSPCGTPARLRWHLAHGQRCERCEAQTGAPTPVQCYQCGADDRPALAAHFAWTEMELARQAGKLDHARQTIARLEYSRTYTRETADRRVNAVREGLELLLRQPVIRHEAVVRLLNLIDN